MDFDAARDAQVRVAEAIRALSGAVVGKEIPAEALVAIAEVVEELAASTLSWETRDLRNAYRDWVLSKCADGRGVIQRPGGGAANPTSIPVTCTWTEEGLVADLMFPEVFASWPGSVFGGAVANILDDLLGQTASHANGFSATTRLEIAYRRPTPTDKVLRATTRSLGREGKYFVAEAAIYDGDELLVTATARFASLQVPGLIF